MKEKLLPLLSQTHVTVSPTAPCKGCHPAPIGSRMPIATPPSIRPWSAALVICPRLLGSVIVLLAMTHFPQPDASRRAPRIHLNGSIPAAVQVEGGGRARAKLQSLSVTGGLLQLQSELSTGDFVEIAFQTRSGPVHGMAEMLQPVRRPKAKTQVQAQAKSPCLQPFRFVALGDQDHHKLSMVLDSALDSGTVDPDHQNSKSSAW
jgi:hypothetical protein